MEERIIKFIQKHRLLTLATAGKGVPYCCNVFYVFDAEAFNFYFMSSKETKHIAEALQHPQVAGTIVSEGLTIASIRGIQFTGRVYQPCGKTFDNARRLYLKNFPVATFFDSDLWSIEIAFVKMTDNTLGFGKKITWAREKEDISIL